MEMVLVIILRGCVYPQPVQYLADVLIGVPVAIADMYPGDQATNLGTAAEQGGAHRLAVLDRQMRPSAVARSRVDLGQRIERQEFMQGGLLIIISITQ